MNSLPKKESRLLFERVRGEVLSLITLVSFTLWSVPTYSLHDEIEVISGEAVINHVDDHTINVTVSDQAILQYSSFNIAPNNTVQFFQPTDTSSVLNRVVGDSGSEIYGNLFSNGTIFLVNPNGILLGPSANVQTGSFVASTLNISDANFLAGHYQFDASSAAGSSLASVLNQGMISSRDGGYIALLGGSVENTGFMTSNLGSVVLAAGRQVTLSLTSDGMLQAVVDQPVIEVANTENAVHQTGTIKTDGGRVQLTAKAVDGIFEDLVNQEGVIEAQSLISRNGEIVLSGDEIGVAANSGTLDVSGAGDAPGGGRVSITSGVIEQSGTVNADALDGGKAGYIEIISQKETILSDESIVSARGHGVLSEGGTVIINSLEGNTYLSSGALVDVSGGEISGNGGFVELSAAHTVRLAGTFVGEAQQPYTSARLLIDPEFIVINATTQAAPTNNATGTPDIAFSDAPDPGTTTVQASDITNFAEAFFQATKDITLDTTLTMAAGGGGRSVRWEAGRDININSALTVQSGGTATLTAGRNVNLAANVSSGTGTITITADATVNSVASDGVGTIVQSSGTSIQSASGNIVLGAGEDFTVRTINANSDGNASVGNVTMTMNTAGSSSKSILDDSNNGTVIRAGTLTMTSVGTSGAIGAVGNEIDTTATSVTATAPAGIFISETDVVTLTNLNSSSSNGNISVTNASGNITVSTINAGTGSVTLTSAADIVNSSSAITGGTVSLTAAGADGDVGTAANQRISLTAATINATATGTGDIFLTEADGATLSSVTTGGGQVDVTSTTGDLSIGSINVGAGNVTLTATTGDINDNANDATADITGATVSLTANASGKGVGTSNGSLDTDATSITLNVGSGGANIADVGSVTLNAPTVAAGGSLTVIAAGTLTLPSGGGGAAITLSGGGGIDFRSNGGNLSTGGNLTTASGSLTLSASGDLSMGHNLTTTNAAINLTADNDNAGGGNLSQTAGAISSGGGTVTMTVGSSGGDATVVNVSAGSGSLSISAPNGSILEGGAGDVGTDLTAGTVTLTAHSTTGAIGASSGAGALETNVSTLNLTFGSGGAFISEANDVTLNAPTIGGTGGSLSVTAGGTLTLPAGSISVNGSGIVDLRSNGGNLSASSSITTAGGTVTLAASNNLSIGADLTSNGGALSLTGDNDGAGGGIFEQTSGTITSGGGTVTISVGASGGDATLLVVNAGSGTVSITSNNGAIVDGNAGSNNVTGGTVTLASKSGVGTSLDPFDTAVTSLTASASAGSVYVVEADGITLTSISASGTGNDAVVSNGSGDITVVTVSAADEANITASGAIVDGNGATNNITATSSTLTAGTSIGSSGDPLDTTITNLTASTTNGSIYINEANALTITNSSVIAAGAGNDVVITNSSGDITVGVVTAPDEVNLTATGSLVDGNGATNNITATSTSLTAGTDVGTSGDPLDITVGSVTTSAKNICLREADAVTLTSLSATGTGINNIVFSNDSGDITVTSVSSENDVTLTAAGALLDGNGDTNNISGDALTLTAGTGIATQADPLDTNVASITATANAGGVFLKEANAVTLTAITATGAGNDVEISNTTGDLTVSAVTAADDVSLTATAGAILDGNGAANNITAASSTLTAGTNLGVLGDPLDTSVATLSATANAGSVFIRESDAVTLASITATGAGNDVVITNDTGDMTVTAVSAADEVNLTAAGGILDNNGATNNLSGASATLTAGTNIGTLADPLDTSVVSFTAIGNAGSVYIREADAVTLTSVTATGAGNDVVVSNDTGTLTVVAVSAPDEVTLTATAGAIADGNGGTNNITANSATLTAGTSIGSSGDPMDTTVVNLTATANAGSVYIREADALTITNASVRALGAGNDVVISNDAGDITLGFISAADEVNLTAAGAILDGNGAADNINASGGSLTAGTKIGSFVTTTNFDAIEVDFGTSGSFTVRAVTSEGDPLTSAVLSGTGTPVGAGNPDGQYRFNGACFFNCPAVPANPNIATSSLEATKTVSISKPEAAGGGESSTSEQESEEHRRSYLYKKGGSRIIY